jgi:hypothetical protein
VVPWLVAALAAAGCSGKGKGGSGSGPARDAGSARDAGAGRPVAADELWAGRLAGPGGQMLELAVTLTAIGDGHRGVVSVPAQKLADLELRDVVRQGADLSFTIAPPGVPEAAWGRVGAKVAADGKTATGTMTVGGTALPIELVRVATADELPRGWKRPQTPQPPFPYQVRDVVYDRPGEGCQLAGTLTAPAGEGRHAAALLISGSGAQDRDETLFDHKPFLVLADALTRRGLVVLRVDDRGVGKTTCGTAAATVEGHADDAAAGVAFLAAQPEVDPARIGLIGHSEGGLIAPLLAARGQPPIAFVITLAGPGISGGELIPLQLRAVLEQQRLEAKAVEALVAEQVKLMAAIQADADAAALEKLLVAAEAVAVELVPGATVVPEEQRAAKTAADLAGLTSPWFRSFVKLDPRTVWPRVKCPALALFGGKDFQVPAAINLREVVRAAAGHPDLTTRTLAGLNHLFQSAGSGMLDEYARIEETMSPAALTLIGEWLTSRNFR